ncbi:hypothetical protein OG739_32905 [Streptomyces longwoodensis]|uniref:Secreted protein n=1 Tax=Streptomyces lasalocidi TaxID=324833 RepID=A0A4U5WRM0_STRLS|nr:MULTISPECIES: hypothetical protein [Streptomyces]MCX4997498.1 hypothetical protein [Streptomyces longwoodensis]TKT04332.1 hypothetical protein E4U91_32715 [Streptomyces lasalocidi]WTI43604.1 hypothetical protein OG547_03315 [Streptomyces longwoodensis]WUC69896.1 hypothetical protein OG416_03285 [Streptomyces longwoodensis]
MISTRRIVAAACLAVGVTGLAAPMANAADAKDSGRLSPLTLLDSLAASELPAEQQGALPPVSSQVNELNKVKQLRRLQEPVDQVAGLVAPLTGLLPSVHA